MAEIGRRTRTHPCERENEAPEVGFEPTTIRLTVGRSTTELLRICRSNSTARIKEQAVVFKSVLNSDFADEPHRFPAEGA